MLYLMDFYQNLTKKILAIIAFLLLPIWGMASSGMAPGASFNFEFYESQVPNIGFLVEIPVDPGYTADVLWNHQFYFNNNLFSTIAMQKSGGDYSFFRWSVFGAKYFIADGTQGSVCQKFSEGVGGVSCRINYDWQQGHEYYLRVLPKEDEPGWYTAAIDERQGVYTVNILNLGSIYVGATGIMGKLASSIVYFDQGNPRTACLDSPFSQTILSTPYYRNSGGLRSYADYVTPQKGSACQDMVSIYNYGAKDSKETKPQSVWYATVYQVSIGLGNSAASQVKPSSDLNQCIDISGGLAEAAPAALYTCKPEGTNAANQSMIFTSKNELRFAQNYCLTAQFDRTVTLNTCDGQNHQKWKLTSDGRIITLIDSYNNQTSSTAFAITKVGYDLTLAPYSASDPNQVFTTQVLQNRH